MRAMLTLLVPVLSLPKNSCMTFGLFPATVISVGEPMCSSMSDVVAGDILQSEHLFSRRPDCMVSWNKQRPFS